MKTLKLFFFAIILLSILAPVGWAQNLGTTNLLEGPTAGSDSVLLAANSSWTATANDSWLHLSADNQSGTGNATVIFTFDANPAATMRTGTLTIAGQTLNVTQAEPPCLAANPVFALDLGLNSLSGVAVDGAGNVYFADSQYGAIKEWIVASNIVTTLVSSGLTNPCGVAADGVGNIYIADSGNNAIKEWIVASNTVTTLVSSGLTNPCGVAVDVFGNVFIADSGNNTIKEWVVVSNTVATLVSSGLTNPCGVAVDVLGNVIIADTGNNAIKEWLVASNTVTALVSSGLSSPRGVAVDGSGNIYIADTGNNANKEWVAASNTVITVVSSKSLNNPTGVAVDGMGNVYVADPGVNAIVELLRAFVDATPKVETGAVGSDTLPAVLPNTANLTGSLVLGSDSCWLTITGVTNGVVSFAFLADNSVNRAAHLWVLGQSIAITQLGPPNYVSLGTTNLLEGPAAGSESVVLAANSAWIATANDSWLHLSTASQSGTGSATVIFTFDANPGATRTSTLTIAGQTLTVIQAGSTYVAFTNVTTLVSSGLSSGISLGVAVDGLGNVYIADSGNSAIKEWVAASNTVIVLVSSGLSSPRGVAVDGVGNVFIADSGNGAIKEWVASSNTVLTLSTPESSGIFQPLGIAVDGVGNIYIADPDGRIVQLGAVNGSIKMLAVPWLNQTYGVAVDIVGNVYFADSRINALQEWLAASNTVNAVTTLVSSGLSYPHGVAVDGKGNVYVADFGNSTIKEWVAASNTVITLASSGLANPYGVAVDGLGDVYIADTGNNTIKELPRAFVNPTAKTEPASGGSDTLPPVLPATANLTGPFAPVSDSSWLTITGVTNGVVSFAFTNNNFISRTAHIIVLNQTNTVTQLASPSFSLLGTTNLCEGPNAGSDSVVLAAASAWTATVNDSWLHLNAANQSGTGNANVIFTFDANPGATRTGSLTIAGWTLTVTQAGSTFVAITNVVTQVSSGLNRPSGVAVDGFGNIYIADNGNIAIKEWLAASNTINAVTTLVSSGLSSPRGVAVDGVGNVFIADPGNGAVMEWVASSNTVKTLVSPGLANPNCVAVDGAGNVCIANSQYNTIKEWLAANNTVTTVVSSGLNYPSGVAVDGAGNVYIAGYGDNTIKEWLAASNTLITLVSSGLSLPQGVAVDGNGNVYIAGYGDSTIKEWLAASNTVITLVSSGLRNPNGVAVDGIGNVFIADTSNNAIKERFHLFVDTAVKVETAAAGNDALSAVLPVKANLAGAFAPVSDSPWLTINGVTNGVVSFAFTANNFANRTAHITLLGQNIAVTQMGPPDYSFLATTNLVEGPNVGSDGVVIAANSAWTTTANDSWLHLSTANQNGLGSANVIFTYDANSGAARTGTLTVAGKTVTVTQAGAAYVAVTNVTMLVSSGLSSPSGVAADGMGNVYIADSYNNAIKEWIASQQHRHNTGIFGIVIARWRGSGRGWQCLHCRHLAQRDQGMDCIQQHRYHAGILGINFASWLGGGRIGRCLRCGHLTQRDQGMAGSQQHRHDADFLGIVFASWHCGGRLWKYLYRRHFAQRDQGMAGHQQRCYYVGVLGIVWSLWRGGGRCGKCLYCRHWKQRNQGMVGSQQYCYYVGVLGVVWSL